MSKHTIVTALRGGTLSAALCAGVLFAPSAIAGENTELESENENNVVSVDDVGSGNAVNVCHNSVNVLGVQAADIANGLAANVPILNDEPASVAEGGANCNATATTVENDDSDNGGGNGDGDNGHNGGHNGDDGHNGGDNGHGNGDNGNGHNGGGNGHNGGGAGNGGADHADANGIAPQPVPAEDHISVTG